MLTREELYSQLDYCSETGIFRWRISNSPRVRVGDIAGHLHISGYVRIRVNGRLYPAQRLAWLYVVGKWPAGLMDHKDLNKSNNRFENLREATHSQNRINTPMSSVSGFRGICRSDRKLSGVKWRAWITVDKCRHHLGYYATPEKAAAAYSIAAKKYFGDFARTS